MKLLDRLADVAARLHLSPLNVECYQRWLTDFLRFCATPAQAVCPPVWAGDPIGNVAGLLLDEPPGPLEPDGRAPQPGARDRLGRGGKEVVHRSL